MLCIHLGLAATRMTASSTCARWRRGVSPALCLESAALFLLQAIGLEVQCWPLGFTILGVTFLLFQIEADSNQCFVCRGAQVRVHWWYHPDSYDEFIPSATAPADIEPDQPHSGMSLLHMVDHLCSASPNVAACQYIYCMLEVTNSVSYREACPRPRENAQHIMQLRRRVARVCPLADRQREVQRVDEPHRL